MTCFITSPSVIDLPSLPACDKSSEDKVKDSAAMGGPTTGLMRGPPPAPQVEAADLLAPPVGASEGKAASELTSTAADCLGFALTGESVMDGKGSGAPSSACLDWDICQHKTVVALLASVRTRLKIGSSQGHPVQYEGLSTKRVA